MHFFLMVRPLCKCSFPVQQLRFKIIKTLCLEDSYLHKLRKQAVLMRSGMPGSLEATTTKKRGEGVRGRVSPSNTIPKTWKGFFLRDDNNKTELFTFLAQQVIGITVEESKVVYATSEQNVLCSSCETDLSNVSPCSKEEADARPVLHAADAGMHGKSKISIRIVDTDVVVLAVSFFSRMNLEEMWIAFGIVKNFRFIAIHKIVSSLSATTFSGLLAFHAFTGCDTVSSFSGRGK